MPARPSVEINDYRKHHQRLRALSEAATEMAEGILKKSGYTPPRGHYSPFMEFLTKLGQALRLRADNMAHHITSAQKLHQRQIEQTDAPHLKSLELTSLRHAQIEWDRFADILAHRSAPPDPTDECKSCGLAMLGKPGITIPPACRHCDEDKLDQMELR